MMENANCRENANVPKDSMVIFAKTWAKDQEEIKCFYLRKVALLDHAKMEAPVIISRENVFVRQDTEAEDVTRIQDVSIYRNNTIWLLV